MRRRKISNGEGKYIILLLVIMIFLFASNQITNNLHMEESMTLSRSIEVNFSKPQLYLPAVDSEGKGVLATLIVEVYEGTGRELINIDKLVFWEDTQQSIQIAKRVACKYAGIEEDSIDVIYSIRSENATVVGGPSAGAALTIATIAALEGKEIDNSVIITGTINEDRTIGPVGGILEKAKAAEENGARLFLIPKGEGVRTIIRPERKCIKQPYFTYCETIYKTVSVSISDEVEIDVREVSTIDEAIKYFIEEDRT